VGKTDESSGLESSVGRRPVDDVTIEARRKSGKTDRFARSGLNFFVPWTIAAGSVIFVGFHMWLVQHDSEKDDKVRDASISASALAADKISEELRAFKVDVTLHFDKQDRKIDRLTDRLTDLGQFRSRPQQPTE
jgi:hypothetical protein